MPQAWGFLSVLAAVLLAAGVVDDLRSRKIHNPLVLGILSVSILAAYLYPRPESSFFAPMLSLSIALALSLVIFALKIWGGGDAKLFLAVSPLLVAVDIPIFLIWSFIWGAVLGLLVALLNGRLLQMFRNMSTTLIHRKGTDQKHLTKVPFSVALLFGHLSICLLKSRGLL